MTVLHERLLAVVEAREQIAKSALGPRWNKNGWEIRTPPSGSKDRNPDGPDWYQIVSFSLGNRESTAEFKDRMWNNLSHIEANDPYFVLKSCARDRKVLERHTLEVLPSGVEICFWCSEDGYYPVVIRYPCPEIKDLAELYEVAL